MARVTILHHSDYIHRASGVRFTQTRVGKVYLGVATDVPDAVAREHFSNPDQYRVEGLSPVESPAKSDAPAPSSETSPPPTTDTGKSEVGAGAPPAGTPVESLDYAALKELAGVKGNVSKDILIADLKARGITHAPAK